MTETEQDSGESKHKEKSAGRIQSVAVDREKLKTYVAEQIDPLDPTGHPKGAAINIVWGKVAHPSVNVHESLRLGKTFRESYESKLPTGFHESIDAGVKTIQWPTKNLKRKLPQNLSSTQMLPIIVLYHV